MITGMSKQIAKQSASRRDNPARKPDSTKPKLSKEARYRAAMKQRGFRLVSMWVPDTSSPRFRAEARRQSLLVARHEDPGINAFLEQALTEIEGWTV